jgi:GTP-binding protein
MRFVDQVRILVRAGNGGKGHVGWRREKFVPYGGPAGGDGGRGGDVVFVADDHLTTLLDLRYQQHYLAESGLPGRNKGQYGRNGEDRRIRVPVGTMVFLEGIAGEPGERPPWAIGRPPRESGVEGDEGGMEVIYVVEDQDGAEYVEAGDVDDEAAPEDSEAEDDEAGPEDSEAEDEAGPEDSEEEDSEDDEDDEVGPEDSSEVEEQLAAASGDAVVDPDAPPPIKREKPARRGRGRRRRRPEPEPLQPGALLVDLVEHGQEVRIARGGRGGRGNIHFRTATNRAPYYAEPGGPGEAFWLRLELKLLADVGIVGFPNVGKSTLIRAISRARPKVGDYPFTTLVPQLGVVSLSGERSMVVADVPGLIRGASEGKGLGLDFLRHLERTRVLLHLLSPDPEEGREPLADLEALEEELSAYGSIFAGRPRVVALNKIDTPEGERLVRATRAALRRRDIPLFPISAATGAGIPELLEALWRRVELGRPKHPSGEPAVEAPQPQ